MDIKTVNVDLLGVIIAGGIMRIVWLLLMLMMSDTPPHEIHQVKIKIRNVILAMAVATALSGIVSYIRGYF